MGSLRIKKFIIVNVSNKQVEKDSIEVSRYIEYLDVMVFDNLLYFGTKVCSNVIKFIYDYRG